MCNPVLQALIMNDAKVDFNVLLGLCVGHDSMCPGGPGNDIGRKRPLAWFTTRLRISMPLTVISIICADRREELE